jgi:hypothetical protein
VIRRLGMLALATAFSRWLQRWERQQRIVATLHSALGRLVNRLITSVWNAWVDLVLGRRRLRGLLGRMQSSSQENRRLQAFRHFCAVVSQAVAKPISRSMRRRWCRRTDGSRGGVCSG